uniref:Uncharacterized protein n=1 Tax=Opuntia streptacantha TaxID=393608 RepID=A0A7C8ZXN9_OPUST
MTTATQALGPNSIPAIQSSLTTNVLLINSNLLPPQKKKLINPVRIWKRFGDAFSLHAPLCPCNQLGAFFFDAKLAKSLIRVKPAVEGNECNVHKPKSVTSKVRLISELSF